MIAACSSWSGRMASFILPKAPFFFSSFFTSFTSSGIETQQDVSIYQKRTAEVVSVGERSLDPVGSSVAPPNPPPKDPVTASIT